MGLIDKADMGSFDKEMAGMCMVGRVGFVDMSFGMNSAEKELFDKSKADIGKVGRIDRGFDYIEKSFAERNLADFVVLVFAKEGFVDMVFVEFGILNKAAK